MSDDRKPVVGEVWTTPTGTEYECTAGPDASDLYVWLGHDGTFWLNSGAFLTPPQPQPPKVLSDWWVNVYPPDSPLGPIGAGPASVEWCDHEACDHRIGRVSLAGEWVPCDGKTVLA